MNIRDPPDNFVKAHRSHEEEVCSSKCTFADTRKSNAFTVRKSRKSLYGHIRNRNVFYAQRRNYG